MYVRIRNIIIALCLILSSCKKESACRHSYGKDTVTYIELNDFNSFTLDGNDVFINLVNDSINFMEIVGGENSSKHIDYKIEDKELIITNNNKCEWLRNTKNRLRIDLHFKDLRDLKNLGDGVISNLSELNIDTIFIHQNGTGNINLELTSERIWLDMYVIGDIELKGKCESLIATVGSFGNLKAKNLKADWVNVKTIHEGDAHVKPMNGISAICEELGDIYYYNEIDKPIISESEEGKVELILE